MFNSVLGLCAAGGNRCCLIAPWWQLWEHLTCLVYSAVQNCGPQQPHHSEAQLYIQNEDDILMASNNNNNNNMNVYVTDNATYVYVTDNATYVYVTDNATYVYVTDNATYEVF